MKECDPIGQAQCVLACDEMDSGAGNIRAMRPGSARTGAVGLAAGYRRAMDSESAGFGAVMAVNAIIAAQMRGLDTVCSDVTGVSTRGGGGPRRLAMALTTIHSAAENILQ